MEENGGAAPPYSNKRFAPWSLKPGVEKYLLEWREEYRKRPYIGKRRRIPKQRKIKEVKVETPDQAALRRWKRKMYLNDPAVRKRRLRTRALYRTRPEVHAKITIDAHQRYLKLRQQRRERKEKDESNNPTV